MKVAKVAVFPLSTVGTIDETDFLLQISHTVDNGDFATFATLRCSNSPPTGANQHQKAKGSDQMNRHDRRKMIAEARKECPLLDLRPGRIMTPVPGTIDWAPDGQSRGVWGEDKPICYMQLCEDGSVRQLSRAETRLYERLYGELDWPIGNR